MLRRPLYPNAYSGICPKGLIVGRVYSAVIRLALPIAWVIVLIILASASAVGQQPSPSAGAEQVRAHAKEILSQAEFQPEAPDSPMAQAARSFRDSVQRGFRWLGNRWNSFLKWLDRLFSGPGGAAAAGVASIVPKIFVFVIIGLGAWLVATLIRSIVVTRRNAQARLRTAYDEADELDDLALEPTAWIAQATTFAESDDFRRAFRAVFVAILLLLDEGGLIEFDRSRTNGDYLRLLRPKNLSKIFAILQPLVYEFDWRWYGRAETSREDYNRIQQLYEQVRILMSEIDLVGSTKVAAPGRI